MPTLDTGEVSELAISEVTEYGAVVGGETLRGGDAYEVRSPYDGAPVATIRRASRADVERAIDLAVRAFDTTRKLPSWKREEVLKRISEGIAARRDELAETLAAEAGKPIKISRGEVDRAVFTFRIAAEESKRIYGELVPLDWLPGLDGRTAQVRRVPLGPIAGITPFNFPLNLVAHKVAPALAAGCPIVVRPASQTPVSALKLAEIVLEAGWPEDGFAVVPSSVADASPLVEDDRIKLLTFTGSPAVGWAMKPRAGRKRVTLELGGNAAVIVHEDADRDYAAERIAWGATVQSGQTCISVQRVYAHESLDGFAEELAERFKGLVIGDPLDDATDIGPLIDTEAADRVEAWLAEAVDAGARVLTGGGREGNTIEPTVLVDLREDMKVSCEEAFAPLVGVYRYGDVREAIRAAGDSEFGLQGGLFTNDLRVIDRAFDEIEVGGLMVNDVSTFRVDHMPYGGVKSSGAGREGLRYAIEEMTEMKLLTFNSRGGL
ncbi:MAG TPA: aldehyde dehydrogenase family protein [Gaiellaceae bacterium]|jgi:glyceraldehyde-3-phosphate dehydrogenase (NADP+)